MLLARVAVSSRALKSFRVIPHLKTGERTFSASWMMVPAAAMKLGTVADGFIDRQHVTWAEDAQMLAGPPSHHVAAGHDLDRRLNPTRHHLYIVQGTMPC
jgi:hypothetical protein